MLEYMDKVVYMNPKIRYGEFYVKNWTALKLDPNEMVYFDHMVVRLNGEIFVRTSKRFRKLLGQERIMEALTQC